MALDEILRNFPIKWLGVIVRHSIFPLGLNLRQPNDSLSHRVASLLIRPGEARDRLTDGIYISNDPGDITGCLEDALHKVIRAEPIERRLRHDQLIQHGLEDYPQWIAGLREAGHIDDDEAEVLLHAMAATTRVIMVDEFTPAQMAPRDAAANEAVAAKKAVTKKSATKKKAAVKKKRAQGPTKN
jgi:acyl-CoA dehydrogenase